MSEEENVENVEETKVEDTIEEVATRPSVEERLANIESQIKSIVEIGQAQEFLIKNLKDQILAITSNPEPVPSASPEEEEKARIDAIVDRATGL